MVMCCPTGCSSRTFTIRTSGAGGRSPSVFPGTFTLPFSAVLGYNVARRALLCTLVDPTLRGVVLAGPMGTGKSALMRSFGMFVREYVDPERPFVQIPVGVGDDRLIGGLDFDAAIALGERVARRGLIADADGGFLFADDLPLLDERSIGVIAGALERESVSCEREGLSTCEPARFILLATVVPSERELPLRLADKVALLIGHEQGLSPEGVQELIARLDHFARDPAGFHERYAEGERRLAEQVITARMLHGLIRVEEDVLGRLVAAALKLNVPGNRAEILAAKAARAHAALRGVRGIEEADIEFAIATVLAPRGENVPDESRRSEEEEEEKGPPEDTREQGGDRPQMNGGRDDGGAGDRGGQGEESEGDEAGGRGRQEPEERVHEPLDFNARLPALEEFFRGSRRNTTPGSRGASEQWRRGRHTRSVQHDLKGKRVAVGATLRAAAPHQTSRRDAEERRVIVRSEDIRVKRYSQRAGTLFIFCVDASGSMAMNRMRETKGAVTRLLQDAYVHRDSVALIAFRGADAEVLLPPTNSVERAKRSLDVLPTGGGTPLASALVKAYAMAAAARRRGVEQTLVVFLTDGRANVPLAESAAGMIMEVRRRHVRQELERLAMAYRREGVRSLVVDTKQTFGAQSEAVRLAEMLGGEYYYLPRIDARGLAGVVRRASI